MINFFNKLFLLEQQISLLGINLKNKKHPIVQRLNLAKERYNSGDKVLACANACYIKFLLEDINIIKKSKNDLSEKFKKILKQENLSLDRYFGIRFEIRIAASLVKKNICFKKSERPDFIIKNPLFGIECTSTHLYLGIEDPPREVFSKLELAIDNKKVKKYSTTENILVVDVTNLIYQEGRNPSFLILADIAKAEPLLIRKINNTPFSSLLYFYNSWIDLKPNQQGSGVRLSSFYCRVNRKNIKRPIKNFLDKFFPKRDLWVKANTGKII